MKAIRAIIEAAILILFFPIGYLCGLIKIGFMAGYESIEDRSYKLRQKYQNKREIK